MDDYELSLEALQSMTKDELIELFATELEYSESLQEEVVELKSYINKVHHELDLLDIELDATKLMEFEASEAEDTELEILDDLGLTPEQRLEMERLIQELRDHENDNE